MDKTYYPDKKKKKKQLQQHFPELNFDVCQVIPNESEYGEKKINIAKMICRCSLAWNCLLHATLAVPRSGRCK